MQVKKYFSLSERKSEADIQRQNRFSKQSKMLETQVLKIKKRIPTGQFTFLESRNHIKKRVKRNGGEERQEAKLESTLKRNFN